MRMNKRLNALIAAMVCLLVVPMVTFANLPATTYGWNMGNTLEPPCGEGCWGPAATQALINAVANAGFNTVRIPCAWDSHANQTTYQIDPVYMARVKQVVDWCYARNLYVIINSHWDNGWLDTCGFRRIDSKITAKINSYWTQIATTFAGYDDHLLFACTNEPAVDTASEMSVLLAYEQTFVDTVRATGGNNPSRWIIVQGPSTDIDLTDQLMNTLPTDPTSGRLMVEVHYYSPYNYTLMTSDESWGNQFYFWGQGYHSTAMPAYNPTWGEEDYLAAEFDKMKTKFVNQGIPVIVGEFGSIKRTSPQTPPLTGADLDLHIRSRTYFHKSIVDAANSRGMKPIHWDIAGVSFDWTTGAEVDSDNINALTGGAALPPPPGGNNPPTVSITSPSNGATFTAPANITINATASDSDGTVTKVDFYQGTTLLGTDTTSPYSNTWNNVAAGSYTLTAKATDNDGATTTSTPVSITVNPAGGATMHVDSIVCSKVAQGPKWKGRAVVVIKDSAGNPVSGATVTGTFSGSYNQTKTATTDAAGTVTLTTTAGVNGTVTFTFCVTNVTKTGATYNSSANVETCDSFSG